MILTSICFIDIQLKQDHSTLQFVKMIQDLHVHMISSWEVNKSLVVLKESMIQLFLEKELSPKELTPKLSKIILIALNMELIHTVEEESDFKELLCYSAVLKTSETHLFSQEIQKELLLENDRISIYHD